MKIFELAILISLVVALSFVAYEIGTCTIDAWQGSGTGKIRPRKNWLAGFWPVLLPLYVLGLLIVMICCLTSVLGKELIFIFILAVGALPVFYEMGEKSARNKILSSSR